jgi:hypothetical protein
VRVSLPPVVCVLTVARLCIYRLTNVAVGAFAWRSNLFLHLARTQVRLGGRIAESPSKCAGQTKTAAVGPNA